MVQNHSIVERCIVSRNAILVQFKEAKLPLPQNLAAFATKTRVYEFFGSQLIEVQLQAEPITDADAASKAHAVLLTTVEPIRASHVIIRIPKDLIGAEVDFVDDHAPVISDGVSRTTEAVEDAVSYALLTESINGSAPGATPMARTGKPEGGAAQLIGQTLRDVLGWKVRDDDPKGFAGALSASFSVADVEGHTQWSWTPRTYAVQTDLNGGITGAQASLYKRAQEALGQVMPLLDGLYPLDTDADADDIAAVKAVVRTQIQELVGELGTPGGPSITRVNRYFDLLLAAPDSHYADSDGKLLQTDPDDLQGTLGRLRDTMGLSFADNFVNSIEDEQDQTNYRCMADYLTSVAQSWLNNVSYFGLHATTPFLGTQLIPLSRQLSVIAESVDELRFTLDSVFIGAAERQTLELNFGSHGKSMYAEDFFRWIQNFVTTEAPTYVQDGGKFGIGNSLVPFARQLHGMTHALLDTHRNRKLPPGFRSARVQRSLASLSSELQELVRLASPLKRDFAIEPSPAQLRAAVGVLGVAALPGVLSFEKKGAKTLATTLLNMSDMEVYVSFDEQRPSYVTNVEFLKPYVSTDNAAAAVLPPGKSAMVQITVDFDTLIDDTQLHVTARIDPATAEGASISTAEVTLFKSGT